MARARALAAFTALLSIACSSGSGPGGEGASPQVPPANGGTTTPPPGSSPPPESPADPAPTDPATPPPVVSPPPLGTPVDRDAVRRENALAGTTAWRLARTAWSREIEGYAGHTSAAPGEAVEIAVSTSVPASYRWIAYRLGWYGGARAREVARGGPLDGTPQPPCPPDAATGLVACEWPTAFRVETDASWPSGAYLVKLVRADGFERYVPFVLRPARRAEVVVVLPTTTWAAYNDWGGASLYADRTGSGRARAYRVAYDRPYARDGGAGHLLSEDLAVVSWLEAQGYDVEYAAVEDVDRDARVLDAARAVIVSAHDEYWTGAYRARVDAAVARGVSLLNLGANNGYWQVRLEPAPGGRERRVVTCYKGDASRLDPVGPSSPQLTTLFRNPPVSRPENALFGVMFDSSWNQWAFPNAVRRPAHWALTGTGLAAGDTLLQTAGYEVDAIVDNGATPPGVEVLAEAPALTLAGGTGRAQMVIRQQGDAWIFSAGGIGFAEALGEDGKADPRVQRIAANVLSRALGQPVPSLVAIGAPPPAASGPFALAVETVATGLPAPIAVASLPGGAVAFAGADDGRVYRLAGGQRTVLASGLSRILGLASDPDGNLYVSDTTAGCVRRIGAGGAATVLAGTCWQQGTVDGVGAAARFVNPAGLALRAERSSGALTLYVADVGASAIRTVDLATATVSTLAAPGLYRPTGVAVLEDGTVIALETGGRRLAAIRDGAVTTLAGGPEGFRDGPAAEARLLPQLGILALAGGELVFSDPGSYRLRRLASGGVSTVAGSGRFGSRDGAGDEAELVLPTGLAAAPDGSILVADTGNGAIRRVRMAP